MTVQRGCERHELRTFLKVFERVDDSKSKNEDMPEATDDEEYIFCAK